MGSVSFSEVSQKLGDYGLSPLEEYLPGGDFRAVRLLKCDWDDRYTLLDELALEYYPYRDQTGALPYNARIFGFGKTSTGDTITVPDWYPNGGGYSIQTVAYEHAILEIQYGYSGATFVNDNYFLSEQITPYTETVNVPTGGMTWETSGEPIRKGGTGYPFFEKHVHGMCYEATFYRVNAVPASALLLQGCCNSAEVGSWTLGLTFAAGYLLYSHFKQSRSCSWAQLPTWTLTYTFIYRPVDWNAKWDPDTNTWDTVLNSNDEQEIFHTPAALNALYP